MRSIRVIMLISCFFLTSKQALSNPSHPTATSPRGAIQQAKKYYQQLAVKFGPVRYTCGAIFGWHCYQFQEESDIHPCFQAFAVATGVISGLLTIRPEICLTPSTSYGDISGNIEALTLLDAAYTLSNKLHQLDISNSTGSTYAAAQAYWEGTVSPILKRYYPTPLSDMVIIGRLIKLAESGLFLRKIRAPEETIEEPMQWYYHDSAIGKADNIYFTFYPSNWVHSATPDSFDAAHMAEIRSEKLGNTMPTAQDFKNLGRKDITPLYSLLCLVTNDQAFKMAKRVLFLASLERQN